MTTRDPLLEAASVEVRFQESTPLRKFQGRLVEVRRDPRMVNGKLEEWRILHFDQLKVEQSEIEYTLPAAVIPLQIRISDRKRQDGAVGQYGEFATLLRSGVEFTGKNDFYLGDYVGHVLDIEIVKSKRIRPAQKLADGTERPAAEFTDLVWHIRGIDGSTQASTTTANSKPVVGWEQAALKVINGKTRSEFMMEALKVPELMAQGSQLINGDLENMLLSKGLVVKDGDRYKVVAK